MSDVFVITNQLGHFWGKSKLWVDGKDPRSILRTRHQDEAVNTLVELSAKDVDLRGQVIEVPVSERGEPVVTVSEIPVPQLEEVITAEVHASDAEDTSSNADLQATAPAHS
jgi:hypothetical protein